MATTTNYGWTTPDDTALVKDGAAAIRTLGSSVDTTTKNLNPQTTTGALAYRSATANINTALPIGTAGQILQVNSGATAPEWATPAGGSGMTKIAAATFSNQATVVVDSCFSATYRNYILFVNVHSVSSASDDFQLQLRNNTPATQTPGYYGSGFAYNISDSLTTFGYQNPAAAKIGEAIGVSGKGSAWQINFAYVGQGSERGYYWGNGIDGDNQKATVFGGIQDNAGSTTGFLLKAATTNITGSYQVYGVAI